MRGIITFHLHLNLEIGVEAQFFKKNGGAREAIKNAYHGSKVCIG